jgi:hypothetical protein
LLVNVRFSSKLTAVGIGYTTVKNDGVAVDWVLNNKEWLFSGAGIAIITTLIAGIKWLRRPAPIQSSQVPSVSQTTNVTVNQGAPASGLPSTGVSPPLFYPDRAVAMATARIIFVDDQSDFPLIRILRKAGWRNVKLIKDVPTFNSPDIVGAAIIFVDIQGVGRALDFKDEGLGLAKAIKTRFGESKKVVIYSAEPRGDTFHEAWDMVDGRLPKTADPYQYLQMIESLLGL